MNFFSWKNVVAKKLETADKTWRRTFALIVAVKHCGRFIITGKSVLYF